MTNPILARRAAEVDSGRLTRTAVRWWGCGQLAVLAAALADAAGAGPPSVLLAAAVAGWWVSLAAASYATFAASRPWPGLLSKVAFRCAALWFASGSCAIAWLAAWLVR